MLKWIVGGLLLLVGLFTVFISNFLSPNDLAGCNGVPNGIDQCAKADAIIAVSGGNTTARAQSAIDLYKAGFAPKIIFSGAAADPNSPSNAMVMKQLAIKNQVPESAILIEGESNTTRENAEKTKNLLDKYNIKTAIITTSPYHVRRTLWEFERAAPGVIFRITPAADSTWDFWYLKPTGWWRVLNELIGISMLMTRGPL